MERYFFGILNCSKFNFQKLFREGFLILLILFVCQTFIACFVGSQFLALWEFLELLLRIFLWFWELKTSDFSLKIWSFDFFLEISIFYRFWVKSQILNFCLNYWNLVVFARVCSLLVHWTLWTLPRLSFYRKPIIKYFSLVLWTPRGPKKTRRLRAFHL